MALRRKVGTGRTAAPARTAGTRQGRRSRLAGAGLVAVLLSLGLYAVWSSWATGLAADRASRVSVLADDYARAATTVTAEQSLLRRYRLGADPGVREAFDRSATALVLALGDVRRDGGDADRALVKHVLLQHVDYLTASGSLFAAVDGGQDEQAAFIDDAYAEPAFRFIEAAVLTAAADNHRLSLAELDSVHQLQRRDGRVTPVVFLAGLLLSALLAQVTRGHRRLLALERGRALHDSVHDALTGLPNRVLLQERLEQALHAGTGTGLLLLDLDRFKEVNDTFGHHYGDELLRQVGTRLTAVLRPVDTVARLGGDEFAVLLADLPDLAALDAVGAKVLSSLQRTFHVEGVELDVEASVGAVLSGVHGTDPAVLLQRADVAMYVSKRQSGVCVYDPAADGDTATKLGLLGDLRRALDRDELVVHYQPKLSISTGDVVGAEALVRWQHPTRGLVLPDAFLPLAEQTGLIGLLTRRVLDLALAQAATWARAGRPVPVAVNLSARLLDEHLVERVTGQLAAAGVPPHLLELEVTESAVMTEPHRARRLLEQLDRLGVRLSLDDFGAGCTSLSQLNTLPVRELKIDRSFVTTMTCDTGDALIVRSVVDLGHNLGLSIVAEGVEDQLTLAALAALGCDVAQGHHLSPPVPAGVFDRWYAAREAVRPAAGTAPVRPLGSALPVPLRPLG